jgi:hypothetical protein
MQNISQQSQQSLQSQQLQQVLQKKQIVKKPLNVLQKQTPQPINHPPNQSVQSVQKPVSVQQQQQKHSLKVKQKKNNKGNNETNPKNRPVSSNGSSGGGVSHKVSFNFKNNKVDKFYCPQLAITKLTKSRPIDLESIPDLPEIPLDKLFGAQ